MSNLDTKVMLSEKSYTDLDNQVSDVTECIGKFKHSSRCLTCIEDSMMLVLNTESSFTHDDCSQN